MKFKIISAFTAVSLSMIVLCSTVTQAADKTLVIETVSSIKVISLKVNKYDVFINKPLLNLSSPTVSDYMPSQNFTKRNRVFELATLFNDKLQQLLAKFCFNEHNQIQKPAVSTDKLKDKNCIDCTDKN